MRDASDELAVSRGCRFDEARGQFAVDWMADYLRLYEGVWAGKPFECRDWQYEFTMRLFGWVRPNESWREELPNSDYIRRFRSAIVFIAKKNKKSPTLAACMVYTLCGDGVEGQKCFPGAKDGAQIRQNVGMHVHEMIRQSEALSAECKINKNLGSVFHEPTRSLLMPLSSDNVRTQKSKEGLNGSTFIDEVHVVDEAFVRRIDRAGISRPEPLHVEVSTAGDDMDSYGYKRFLYAERVISGDAKDDQTLAMIYAAPQNLSDADLAADPVKYGKMANPAWGHTVKEAEFLADYQRSKETLRGLADFKMYRLNIWQASATPWLDMAAWDLTKDRIAELTADAPTWAGLDLSSKNDFTAFVAVQQHGDEYHVHGHYWITESRARKHSDAGLGVYDWASDGWLTIIPGERIEYDVIEEYVAEFVAEHDVREIGHDPWNAEALRQRLTDRGATMVEVPQTFSGLTDASKSLETLVSAGSIIHGGDPVLRWMAKNVTAKRDANDNIRPVKPDRQSMKAVDGIVSLIMAVGGAERAKSTVSYEPGAMFL
jgi:phage terminase large subunit-like protein